MARQAWNRGADRDRDALERMVALLLALAALVDRAAGLPAVQRLHLLAVLGSGEAEARSLILALASDRYPVAPAGSAATPPPAAADAALLAARFRMLALAVEAMLAQAGPGAPHWHASPFVSLPPRNPRLIAQSTPSPAQRATSPPAGAEE